MSLGQAKTIAVVFVVILVASAVASAWIMKTIAQKAALVVIMILLAVLVWTQRTSLDECADKVREAGVRGDTTCSFFGRDVRVSTNRGS
jgi:protein-S-isoprenylcysteine O-methyltransferase Ste14